MNIILFTNSWGIKQFVSSDFLAGKIRCVIGAFNRQQEHGAMREICTKHGIAFLIQPAFNSKNYEEFLLTLNTFKPTHLISNTYSLIIRPDVLNLVHHQALNIHWSLLPKNRGPNPIQWSLIKGENETGVSIHKITDIVDQGPVLVQKSFKIKEDDTWVTIFERLVQASQILIDEDLENALANIEKGKVQDEDKATTNHRLNSDFPVIETATMSDVQIYNLIRAQISPLNGAFLTIGNEKIYFKNLITMDDVRSLRKHYSTGEVEALKAISLKKA